MLPRVLLVLRRMLSATLVRLAALVLGLGLVFALSLALQLSEVLESRRSLGLSASKAVADVLTVDLSAASRSALEAVGALVLAGAGVLAVLLAFGAALTGILLLGALLDVWEWFNRL